MTEAEIERWWATYNAALSRIASLYTHDLSDKVQVGELVHEACVWYANRAHGELKP